MDLKYFDKKLEENIKSLYDRVFKNGKASLIIIDGGIGEGKTTLAVEIADKFNLLHGKPLLKLEIKDHPQLSLGGREFTSSMRKCFHAKQIILIYDEAGDFNKRGSISRFNQMLNRVFETYRGFKVVVILCLPCFEVLDQWLFLNNIPRLLIHLEKRNNKYGQYKAYSLYRMMYIKSKMKKFVIPTFAYAHVEPNFRGQFYDLEPDRSEKLNKISIEGKLLSLKRSVITLEGLISYKQLAERLNKSVMWIKRAMKKCKITHEKIIDQTKYFDESVLNRLVDYNDTINSKRR